MLYSLSSKQNLWLSLCMVTLCWFTGTGAVWAQDPGLTMPATSELSDQKLGSVLFYNLFASSASNSTGENTEVGLTNTNLTSNVIVRLFAVSGASGATGRMLLNIAPGQTVSFLTSDVFPGVRGYLVAVAVDGATGCPINFNYLMGNVYLKLASGHAGYLNAVAFAAIAATPAACGGPTTTLNFDGTSYNRAPRVLSLPSITARADGNDTLLIVNRVGGNLSFNGTAAAVGSLFGLLYDDAENVVSYAFNTTGPQRFDTLRNGFPSTSPSFETFIPAGRSGWTKLYNFQNDFGYLGAALNRNANLGSSANAFAACDNLSYSTLTTAASLTIPVGFPDLTVSKTHSGNFAIGGMGSYTINVSNVGTQPLGGLGHLVRLSDTLPNNLTLRNFSGAGWDCVGTGTRNVFCWNANSIAAGGSLAPLVLNVNIGAGTPSSITNTVLVHVFEDLNSSNNVASDASDVCQIGLAPFSASFTPQANMATINVVASSNWTAVSNVPWITITGGQAGSGNGTISYSVANNPGTAPRSGTITVNCAVFTVYQAAPLNDIPTTHPFYTEISKLYARGVTLGCGDGNYCPDANVTREQMAAFIIRALHASGYVPPPPAQQRFQDVLPSNLFYAHIEEMAVRQITSGCGVSPPIYCPTNNVTREQMAAFIIRALHDPGYVPPPNSQRFQDVPPSSPFFAHIEEMATRQITLGCSSNPPLYCPTDFVTRAQMAAFLVRAFGW